MNGRVAEKDANLSLTMHKLECCGQVLFGEETNFWELCDKLKDATALCYVMHHADIFHQYIEC